MRASNAPRWPRSGIGAALLAALTLVALPVPRVDAARATSSSFSGIRATLNSQRTTSAAANAEPGVLEHEDERLTARLADLRARPSEYSREAVADFVPHLPGWGSIDDFNMFAGYITVDDANGRALFYILAEARNVRPSETQSQQGTGAGAGTGSVGDTAKPLVLWLNGGPGCSSIGGGFMTELGPFFPLPGGWDLQRNPHAWNEFAHVLFLESPAFVGFSYSNTTLDAIVGDARTAADSRIFLLRFLERFPRFRETPFYVSGESYAGHYVPNLALAIVEGNKAAAATEEPKINLKGFLVGNPWTDAAIDNMGAIDYWWTHALVSDQTAQGVRANCNFSRIGPLDPHPAHQEAQTRDELCDDFCNRAFDELGSINIYEIYADLCDDPPNLRRQVEALHWALAGNPGAKATSDSEIHSSSSSNGVAEFGSLAARAAVATSTRVKTVAAGGQQQQQQQQQQQRPRLQAQNHRPNVQIESASTSYKSSRLSYAGDGSDAGYDPCIDDETEIYLNLPEVQKALHANQTVKLPWRWTDCTRSIVYSREDLLSSMLPVYDRLLQANLRILIYSGDVDGIVPVVGTRRWVSSLRLKERAAWRPWFSGTQVGGYVVEYQGLTFATVRGAGHMVPYVQPVRAAHMIKTFLAGQAL
ncbi:hypothetical protein VaNZ11_002203 [Volvox africanus]|uniref:Carboxypeptidase n=1 Tax=Volvox africanus TaxID=51714 RepID=A0ABQ5RRD8_9CHLO|nr:hypothetical protein VaNZ11_002203 [Volvox africanus]